MYKTKIYYIVIPILILLIITTFGIRIFSPLQKNIASSSVSKPSTTVTTTTTQNKPQAAASPSVAAIPASTPAPVQPSASASPTVSSNILSSPPTPTQTSEPAAPVTPSYEPAPSPEANTPPSYNLSGTKKVLGFTTYYYNGDNSSYNSMLKNTGLLDLIASASHVTDGYGNITGLIPSNQVAYAHSNNITPLLLVGNNFNSDVASTLLSSPANRQNFTNNLVSIISSNGYKGVNIDLEFVSKDKRNDYTIFISELSSTLHPLGYIITVSLPAKTFDNPSNTWTGAYDYGAISKYCDYILVMTYDEHYPDGQAGPVASIGWVSNVIDYTLSVIPKDKVFLGIAAYGYDWSASGTKAYSLSDCYELASNYASQVIFDDSAKSPHFNYTDTSGSIHNVWFENSDSLTYKLDLVNSRVLAGVGIWRLGLENEDYVQLIKQKFER